METMLSLCFTIKYTFHHTGSSGSIGSISGNWESRCMQKLWKQNIIDYWMF